MEQDAALAIETAPISFVLTVVRDGPAGVGERIFATMKPLTWTASALPRIAALLAALALGAGCAPTDLAHQQVLEPFPAVAADFEAHRDAVSGYLARNRVAADPSATADEVALNAPFERRAAEDVPYRGRFLLFHGLSDSPFIWRDLADGLSGMGFDVRAVLLPGHGVRPGAMLDVRYEDWLAVARGHLAAWHDRDVPIHLGGFSLGGVIATVLALEEESVDGLLLFAPAWRSEEDGILWWSSVVGLARAWAFTGPSVNPVRYGSVAVNAGVQYYDLTAYLLELWGDRTLDIPALVVVTTEDSVVDAAYVRTVFRDRLTASGNRLLIYSAGGAEPRDGREIVRAGAYPAARILNLSHMSLMIAPENPRYGRAGDLIVCNGASGAARTACRSAPLRWHGAWGTRSPDGTPVARSTYNPDFDFVLEQARKIFAPEDGDRTQTIGRAAAER